MCAGNATRQEAHTENGTVLRHGKRSGHVVYLHGGRLCDKKTNLITKELRSGISDLLVYVLLPCMVFDSLNQDMTVEELRTGAVILAMAFFLSFLVWVVGLICWRRYPTEKRNILRYGTLVANSGFAGLPVIQGTYGPDGLFLASIFIIANRVLMWSAGVSLFGKGNKGDMIKKVLLNPGIIPERIIISKSEYSSFFTKNVPSFWRFANCFPRKSKVHTFIALMVAALVTAIIGGMELTSIVSAITGGFGNTLASTGIIIGLGVMMGGILEKSGAAEKMAYSFIQAVGKKKEEWALAITGWFIAIPVFADSAIVIFAPLCKAISKVSGKSVVGLGLAMAAGLQLTHCLVPPTPGPTTAANMLGVDVGQMIMLGSAISVLMLVVAVFYCMWIGKRIYQIPTEDGGFDHKEFKQEYIKSMDELNKIIGEKQLPSLFWSIAPIIVPLVLILTQTILGFVGIEIAIIALLGEPIVALGIGTLLAIYGLMAKAPNKEVLGIMDAARPLSPSLWPVSASSS